jgi:protein TonB
MHTRFTIVLVLLFLASSLALEPTIAAAQQEASDAGPQIVSPTRPKDSRGETVYEGRRHPQKDQQVVSGIFVQASPIKMPDPKYPKSLKKVREDADLTVEGVVSENGDYIDAKVIDQINPNGDIQKSALEAVARYKFKPATLDGKPVAVLTRVVIHFRIQ